MTTYPDNTAFPLGGMDKGLTKREYFAALALAGHCAVPNTPGITAAVAARWSVQCADALIDALNAPTKEGEKP